MFERYFEVAVAAEWYGEVYSVSSDMTACRSEKTSRILRAAVFVSVENDGTDSLKQ